MLQQQHVWHCTETLSVCPWHASPSRSPGIRPSVGSSHFLEVEKFGQVKKETRFGCQEWRNRKNRVFAAVVASGALTENSNSEEKRTRKPVYFVDIHALCYEGSKVRPSAAMEWMRLLFAQVTQDNPVIAVMDGERGNEYRRALMPSYKSKRNRYRPLSARTQNPSSPQGDLREALPLIHGFLSLCHVPVVKLEMAEADDVVATLVQQAVDRGFRAVVASPDMDFRKLLSPDVCMLLPLPEFGRWSFYTLEHYVAQNQISPELELGLRCLLGDSSDSIPGLPELATGFGRKTALKLIKKHGSLEELLNAVAKRTVGKPYVQEALTLHAPTLWRNLQVLSLRRDLEIILKDEWCQSRKSCNDTLAFQLLEEQLQRLHRSHKSAIFTHRNISGKCRELGKHQQKVRRPWKAALMYLETTRRRHEARRGSKRKHSDDDDVHLLHLRHGKPTREMTACMERDKRKMDAFHAPGHVPHLQQLPVSCSLTSSSSLLPSP